MFLRSRIRSALSPTFQLELEHCVVSKFMHLIQYAQVCSAFFALSGENKINGAPIYNLLSSERASKKGALLSDTPVWRCSDKRLLWYGGMVGGSRKHSRRDASFVFRVPALEVNFKQISNAHRKSSVAQLRLVHRMHRTTLIVLHRKKETTSMY